MIHPSSNQKKLLVIKWGGSIIDEAMLHLLDDLQKLHAAHYQFILVHGGGVEISQLCTALKINNTFVDGLRVTSAEILSITQMVLIGKINANLVKQLNQAGLPALGLSGHDADLLSGSFIDQAHLGYVGGVEKVNVQLLKLLLDAGLIPVIAPLTVSPHGDTLNVNADTAAAAIAASMRATQLILLSDIDGYYANYPDPKSLVTKLTAAQIIDLLKTKNGVNQGMYPKLNAALHAVERDVNTAHIVNGKEPNSLLRTVLNPGTMGTSVIRGDM
jgi:acetylglutamate kinase